MTQLPGPLPFGQLYDKQFETLLGPIIPREIKMHGVAAVPGVEVAPPLLIEIKKSSSEVVCIPEGEIEYEIGLLQEAVTASLLEIHLIREVSDKVGQRIVNANEQMIKDLAYLVTKELRKGHTEEGSSEKKFYSAATEIDFLADDFEKKYALSQNEHIRKRTEDMGDARDRLKSHIYGEKLNDFPLIDKQCIIVAEKIRPSLAAALNADFVKGVATLYGGPGDHNVDAFRAKGIPYIVCVGDENLTKLEGVEQVAMDGTTGEIFFNPSEETIKELKSRTYVTDFKLVSPLLPAQPQSLDKTNFSISLNISNWEKAGEYSKLGAAGVGLYRSEIAIEAEENYPSAEAQAAQIVVVSAKMGFKPVRARTLDISGDKADPPWYKDHSGAACRNPDLAGLRLSLHDGYNLDLFRVNVEAILRASKQGPVEMMFPMVLNAEQLDEALREVELVKISLNPSDFAKDIKIGVMIENPIAVFGLEQIAKRADFVCIGTNDLKWRLLEISRDKSSSGYVAAGDEPAFLIAVSQIVETCEAKGIPVYLCGQHASDPLKIPILIGCGVRNFSCMPEIAGQVNSMISICLVDECVEYVNKMKCAPGPKATAVYWEEMLQILKKRAKEMNLLA